MPNITITKHQSNLISPQQQQYTQHHKLVWTSSQSTHHNILTQTTPCQDSENSDPTNITTPVTAGPNSNENPTPTINPTEIDTTKESVMQEDNQDQEVQNDEDYEMATAPCNFVNVSACEGDDVVVDNKSNKEDDRRGHPMNTRYQNHPMQH